MIVSHLRRFIFIHASKTAGTSLAVALSESCGTADVLLPMPGEADLARTSLGFPGPQNFNLPIRCWRPKDFAAFFTGGGGHNYSTITLDRRQFAGLSEIVLGISITNLRSFETLGTESKACTSSRQARRFSSSSALKVLPHHVLINGCLKSNSN